MQKPPFNFQQGDDTIDFDQVDQFQPEFAPRSTSAAHTDPNAMSQEESRRFRDQGDPNEYSTRFEDQ